jgi:aminopeptidase N
VLSHDLRVRIDPDRRYLFGEDTLRLRLLTESPSVRLRLDERLTIHSVAAQSGAPCLFFRQRQGSSFSVTLGSRPKIGSEAALTIRYSGVVRAAQRDTDALQIFTDESYRQQTGARAPQVYSSDPAWYPQAEYTDYSTARLQVDVPEGYVAVSGGERGPAQVAAKRVSTEFIQDRPVRYLVLIVGRLSEAGQRESHEVKLAGYGTAETRSEVPQLLDRSARILDYFGALFGPCPYPSIALVYTEGLTPGGHSPPGVTILSRRSLLLRPVETHDPGDFSDVTDFFLAHELAHQWWGHGVAPANYRERWLSEAMAHYAAAQWVRHSQGGKAFEKVLERMGRWTRRETNHGPISLGRRLGHLERDNRIYRAIVYDKGAVVLQALAALLGEQAFSRGLREVQAQYRFQTLTTVDLRLGLETVSGKELTPYLAQWVHGTTLPTVDWSYRAARDSEEWMTTVTVTPRDLPGPLPLEIVAETPEAVETTRDTLLPQGGVFSLRTRALPREVEIRGGWMFLLARPPRGN